MTLWTAKLAVALSLVVCSGPANAHDTAPDAGPLVNGILHPLIVPAHLLILIGLSLWIGQFSPRALCIALATFAVALAGGLTATDFLPMPPAILLPALAGVTGALAASAWMSPRWLVACLAAGAGAAIGLDSGGGNFVGAAGMWLGAILVVFNGANLVARIHADWLRIGTRIAGAWIAAIAILMLALGLKG